jgi:DegV family protein with EDD domain
MEYLTQKEFKKMMLLSWEKIEKNQEDINKINVFPVPDQDTGSNLAKTLSGIKEAIKNKEFQDLADISKTALDGALTAAQGNAGVIYTGFLAGFLPQLNKNPVNGEKLAKAFQKGAERARESIQDPKEGTILDVIDAAAQTLESEAPKEKEIGRLFQKAIEKANKALLATRDKMEIFRKANVVDAGGLGFLMILESYLEGLEGGKKKREKEKEVSSEKIKRFVQTLSQRYEVVFLVENKKLEPEELEKKLAKLGNSIEVIKIGQKTKVHVHTDFPDEVKGIARESGKILSLRVEDMAKEVVGEESIRKISIGIVTDDVAGLLPKIIERYQIEVAPTKVSWPAGEKIPGENVYQKMRKAEKLQIKEFPKTSQATPKAYLDAFEKQLQKGFEKILCITATSKLSGCYNSALQAEEMVEEPERIFVFDSLQALGAQALLVFRAVEMVQEQREIAEIIKELKRFRFKTHFYGLFEDPKWIEAGGRISKSQAKWIRRMKKLHLHPLITLKNGVVKKGGVVWAQDGSEALYKKIKKESQKVRKGGKKIRVIINQADNLQGAKKLKKKLKEIKFAETSSHLTPHLAERGSVAEVSFISLVNPVVGAHLGPGGLVASWAPIE